MSVTQRFLFVLAYVVNAFGVGYFADKAPVLSLIDGVYITIAGLYIVQEMEPFGPRHTNKCNCNDQSNCKDCGCYIDSYTRDNSNWGAVKSEDEWKPEHEEEMIGLNDTRISGDL